MNGIETPVHSLLGLFVVLMGAGCLGPEEDYRNAAACVAPTGTGTAAWGAAIDDAGNHVANVSIEADPKDDPTEPLRAVTGMDGCYRLDLVPGKHYVLDAYKEGYNRYIILDLVLEESETRRIDVKLSLATD